MRKMILAAVAAIIALIGCEAGALPVPNPPHAPREPTAKMTITIVSAPWCSPCRALHADLKAHPDVLADYTVEDKGEREGRILKVQAYPTIILYDDSLTEVKRTVGLGTAQEILDWASNK